MRPYRGSRRRAVSGRQGAGRQGTGHRRQWPSPRASRCRERPPARRRVRGAVAGEVGVDAAAFSLPRYAAPEVILLACAPAPGSLSDSLGLVAICSAWHVVLGREALRAIADVLGPILGRA